MLLRTSRLKYVIPKQHQVIMFTANTVVKSNGELVMGAGNAKACREAYRGCALAFGNLTVSNPNNHILGIAMGEGMVAAFRTKNDWRSPSTLDIIKQSVTELLALTEKHPHMVWHLPFPGCSNGGLAREDVLPLLLCLPVTVHIYLK